VVELRSPTDSLAALQAKMQEYLENGARLGWLIDPESKLVHVYRPDRDVERVEGAAELSGDTELPDFVFDLRAIWSPGF
jgi:Uma2 family endonuclease